MDVVLVVQQVRQAAAKHDGVARASCCALFEQALARPDARRFTLRAAERSAIAQLVRPLLTPSRSSPVALRWGDAGKGRAACERRDRPSYLSATPAEKSGARGTH